MSDLKKLRNVPKVLRAAIPRWFRRCTVAVWINFWQAPAGRALSWFLNRIWEAQAWFILIRPWQAKYRNNLDWWYAATWYLNHWVFFVFTISAVLEIWPHFSGSLFFQYTEWTIPHPHRIEEHIPILVSATTLVYVILNQRDKRLQRIREAEKEPRERWRGGQIFPLLWMGFFITFMWILEPLGLMPSGHVATDAAASIFYVNGAIRVITYALKKSTQRELRKAQRENRRLNA